MTLFLNTYLQLTYFLTDIKRADIIIMPIIDILGTMNVSVCILIWCVWQKEKWYRFKSCWSFELIKAFDYYMTLFQLLTWLSDFLTHTVLNRRAARVKAADINLIFMHDMLGAMNVSVCILIWCVWQIVLVGVCIWWAAAN